MTRSANKRAMGVQLLQQQQVNWFFSYCVQPELNVSGEITPITEGVEITDEQVRLSLPAYLLCVCQSAHLYVCFSEICCPVKI